MKRIGATNVSENEVKVPLVKVKEEDINKDNFV